MQRRGSLGRRSIRIRAIAATMFALALAGCTAGNDDKSASVADLSLESGGGLSETPAEAGDLDPNSIERDGAQIIHNADLDLATKRVDDARNDAIAIAESNGGFVDSEDSRLGSRPTITLVLKVDPDRFRAALDALQELGTVLERSESSENVTQQVVDLDARIEAARTSTDRLRELLEGQGTLDDIVKLEGALSQREADLESLRALRQALSAEVDHATITVHLRTPPKAPSDGEPSEKIPGFLRGLKTGWAAFVNVVLGIVTVAGFLLPFAAAIGVLALLTTPLRRRITQRRRDRRSAAASVTTFDHRE